MIFPFENYLNLLFVRGLDDVTVAERLEFYALLVPDQDSLDSKRSEVEDLFPVDTYVDYPLKEREVSALARTNKQVIETMGLTEVLPTLSGSKVPAWEECLTIMYDRKTRILAQSMLVMGESEESIIEKLRTVYRLHVSLDGLSLFQKYFWNISGMTRRELMGYVSALPSGKYRDTLASSVYGQRKTVAWDTLGENALALDDVLTTIMNESFQKFKEYVGSKDPEKIEASMRWANMAIKTAEKFKRGVNGTDDIVRALKITLETENQDDLPMIDTKDVI